jgi:hypothetical protein
MAKLFSAVPWQLWAIGGLALGGYFLARQAKTAVSTGIDDAIDGVSHTASKITSSISNTVHSGLQMAATPFIWMGDELGFSSPRVDLHQIEIDMGKKMSEAKSGKTFTDLSAPAYVDVLSPVQTYRGISTMPTMPTNDALNNVDQTYFEQFGVSP